MATYGDFIKLCRQDVHDFPIRRQETANSDGVTLIYQLQNPKIYEGSLVVQLNQGGNITNYTENSDYTVDYDVGQVIFNQGHQPPSGQDNVMFAYQSTYARDTDFLDMTNQVLLKLRKKLWIEVVNQTAPQFQTGLNQVDYPLFPLGSDVLSVIDVEYQTDPTAPWQSVRGVTNLVFYRDLQTLHMRPAFSVSGYQMRIRALRAYNLNTAVNATFEPQARYWPILRDFVEAEYWERRASLMARETGALTKEANFEGIDQLKKLAESSREEATVQLKSVKMVRPPQSIPTALFGTKA